MINCTYPTHRHTQKKCLNNTKAEFIHFSNEPARREQELINFKVSVTQSIHHLPQATSDHTSLSQYSSGSKCHFSPFSLVVIIIQNS